VVVPGATRIADTIVLLMCKFTEDSMTFKPHAIILGERTIPEPIFVAALMGPERILRVEFDCSEAKESWAARALEGVRARLAEFGGTGLLPAFGVAIGFVVNYAPDFAVRFELDGTPKELLATAYRIGHASLLLGGKPIRDGMALT
jgi:hypothetical protein